MKISTIFTLLLMLTTIIFNSCSSEKDFSYPNKITLGASDVDQLINAQELDFDKAQRVIEKRLELLDLKEYQVSLVGKNKDRIEIQYNGEFSQGQIDQLLRVGVKSGFYATYDFFEVLKVLETEPINAYLIEQLKLDKPGIEVDSLYLQEHFSEVQEKYFPAILRGKQEFSKHEAIFIYSIGLDTAKISKALKHPIFKTHLEELSDLSLKWGYKSTTLQGLKNPVYGLYALKTPFDEEILISSNHIESCEVFKREKTGSYVLNLELNSKGTELLEELTRANLRKQIAFVVNDNVVSAPVIVQEIEGGRLSISGPLPKSELDEIKRMILSPILPFKLGIVPNE